MRIYKANRSVRFSKSEIEAFKRIWPCSGLPSVGIWFQFASNGDLVDMGPYKYSRRLRNADGGALLALAHDAQDALGKALGE